MNPLWNCKCTNHIDAPSELIWTHFAKSSAFYVRILVTIWVMSLMNPCHILWKFLNDHLRFEGFVSNELFIPFFDFRFSLVLADEVTKIPEYYVICLFTFFESLACLALQTETIVKKITQPKLPKTKNEITKICNEPGIGSKLENRRYFSWHWQTAMLLIAILQNMLSLSLLNASFFLSLKETFFMKLSIGLEFEKYFYIHYIIHLKYITYFLKSILSVYLS